ncbi:MAG: hypothetical protein ABGW47_02810, partial [Nitrosopumilus sp.]
TFNENNLENSELKKLGVGKILDTLASLKDRKMISQNNDGSFSITDLAKEILWSRNVPTWAKILRLLQIKSCTLNQIIMILKISEDKLIDELKKLRKNQFILMSPQRKEEKIIKVYEILLEGIEKIDSTETKGFNNIDSKEKSTVEIFSVIDEIIKEVQESQMEDVRKDIIVEKLFSLKNKLGI